jgi:8-oxo-dGTP pyrophosphatase MutT (NUDIX family)
MHHDDDLPTWLAGRLARPLPGPGAHARFAPELNYGRHHSAPFPDTRTAAVLILLFRREGQWMLPLTVRPQTMSTHAGQVSFPGGIIEPGETAEQAALREYEEELGTLPAGVSVLGRLTPLLVYASNCLVSPCVACCSESPRFQPNPNEVAHVLEAALQELADATRHSAHCIRRGEIQFRAPHILHQEYRIWGATCMMLAELFAVWREFETL